MKISTIFSLLFLLLFSSSCENLERKFQEKVNLINEKAQSLDSLMNEELEKMGSLDSMINRELDKVNSLDSLIDQKLDKVNSLDSLFNDTSSKVDSMVQGKMDRINRIIN
ncbi:hypothetical protein SAMN00777080_0719 [Aquiflexum balticum DSM 16537]|uniref:Uncharacterized protein n=1 Tax=Aquiflexum balticum DSM 16537 TaxID=758820 RepID=A0A1W2GZR9_9BACT|nr:hypothetical protein [Aquiflexum balticum]SMD42180.1 hypothetical protein SAMN00777080_0719 [Aquiflexum balticum DSM 16537]